MLQPTGLGENRLSCCTAAALYARFRYKNRIYGCGRLLRSNRFVDKIKAIAYSSILLLRSALSHLPIVRYVKIRFGIILSEWMNRKIWWTHLHAISTRLSLQKNSNRAEIAVDERQRLIINMNLCISRPKMLPQKYENLSNSSFETECAVHRHRICVGNWMELK